MFYDLFSLVVAAVAVVIAIWVIKFLLKGGWLLGWLRGMTGLAMSAVAILLLLVALDIFSYRQLLANQTIASISFIQRGDQRYDAILVYNDGYQQSFEIHGDQWQIDARIFQWIKPLYQWGVKPGYRLDRISGRYLTLDDENTKKRTVYSLSNSSAGVDTWAWLRGAGEWFPFIDARYGSATFLPMVDGGQYDIALSSTGLLSRPLNEPARNAVDRWR